MLPVALNLSTLRVLLIGSGPLAEKRLRVLNEVGAKHMVQKAAAASDEELRAADVVLIAGLPLEEAKEIAARARMFRVLVNVEDVNEYCDFYFTAHVKRGDLTIAVSTNGASPTLARVIRGDIAARYGKEWETRTQEMAAMRQQWKAEGKSMKEVGRLSEEYIVDAGWLAHGENACT